MKKKIQFIALLIVAIFYVTMAVDTTEEPSPCSGGHDHSSHDESEESDKHDDEDDHAGHDHSEHEDEDDHDEEDEHAGHDHSDHEDEDEHAGHDHSDHEDEDDHDDEDDHAGHDHGDEDDHSEGGHLELTQAIAERVGVVVEEVAVVPVTSTITVPGIIQFNEDRLAHIIPSYPSNAVRVSVRQGQYVRAGAVLATLTNRATLSQYTITSPISGTVLTKHIIAGEVVNESDTLFTIANLGSVWAEFAVTPDRLAGLSVGTDLDISILSLEEQTVISKVNYISPVTDPISHRVTVRSTLSNSGNKFRPGTYVTADIDYGEATPVVAVERDAVQNLGGETIVFVPEEDEPFAYRPVEVTIGRSNSRYIEIVSGLSEHDEYISEGAFSLKAEMVTADMDPHAGHNH